MSKRERVAEALDRSGALRLLLETRARVGSPWITVLAYHRVGEPSSAGPFANTFDVRPERLESDLAFVKRWFDVIGVDDLIAHRRGGALPPNPVMITFDDGYVDNHDVALPILERAGVKATFFIATSFVDERRLFWWDRISYLVQSSTRDAIAITYPEPLTLRLGAEREASARLLLDIVKQRYALDLPRFMDGIAEAAGVALGREEERRLADRVLMTWEQVRDLRARGMDVQSHSSAHRVLQTVPLAELARDLTGAREKLEAVLGEPVRTIAYPVGPSIADDPAIRAVVRAAGYDIGFSYRTGKVNYRWAVDPYDVRRMATGIDVAPVLFQAMLAYPGLAAGRPVGRAASSRAYGGSTPASRALADHRRHATSSPARMSA
jgi:peptidoglycan/xylan/chitin deacetylase (PgdA/CDA1 family)